MRNSIDGRRTLLRFLSVSVLLCVSCAAPSEPDPLTRKQLAMDLELFRTTFEEGHAGLYRYSTKAEMDRVFERASLALPARMSLEEFYRLLSTIVAAVRCGHTELLPTPAMKSRIEQSEFPFDVRVIDGKLYVLHDYSTEDDRMRGSEILAVNGRSADQLLDLMLKSVGGDGWSATQRAYRIGNDGGFAQMLGLICGVYDPFEVKLRTVSGEEQAVRTSGLPAKRLKNLSNMRYGPGPSPLHAATLTFLDNGRAALLKIHGFGGIAGLLTPLNKFFDQSFHELHEKGTKSLIVDLRDNDGGQPELGEQVFSYLANGPFLYYKDLILNARSFSFQKYADSSKPISEQLVKLGSDGKYHHTAQANWGVQQPRQPHFGGKVYMLLNGGSFSVTAELLAMAKSKTNATLIGEESGGAFSGNTSGMKYDVKLPNSKIVLRVPVVAKYVAVDESKQPMDRGVIPDVRVHYSIAESIARFERTGDKCRLCGFKFDKEMDVALDLARHAK